MRIRRRGKVERGVEKISVLSAEASLNRCDVALVLIDAAEGLTDQDEHITGYAHQAFRPCIIVVNKWDLAKNFADTQDYADYLDKVLVGIRHAPIAFTTATEAKNIQSVLDLTAELYKQANMQIPTGKLNKAVEIIAEERAGASRKKGGFPKIYYATQVAANPICILLFVNNPGLFDDTYQRFVTNRLGELLGLEEVPIRLLLRKRS